MKKRNLKIIILAVLMVLIGAVYSYGVWPRAIYNTDIGANSYENTGKLTADMVLTQTFTCTDKGLCGFSIKLTKLDNQEIGTYRWSVKDAETGKEIGKGKIDESSTENPEFVSSSAQKRGNIKVEFSAQPDSAGKKYVLTIQGKKVQDNETMAVYVTEKGNNDSVLQLNGENIEKASVIKLQYKRFNVETFLVFLVIILYLAVFVKFMYKLFK